MIEVIETINNDLKILLNVFTIFLLEPDSFSKYLRQNWIPKSTEIPINKTANATEIMLSFPTKTEVNPSVIDKPTTIVSIKEKMNILCLNVKNRITITKNKLKTPALAAPFETDLTSS